MKKFNKTYSDLINVNIVRRHRISSSHQTSSQHQTTVQNDDSNFSHHSQRYIDFFQHSIQSWVKTLSQLQSTMISAFDFSIQLEFLSSWVDERAQLQSIKSFNQSFTSYAQLFKKSENLKNRMTKLKQKMNDSLIDINASLKFLKQEFVQKQVHFKNIFSQSENYYNQHVFLNQRRFNFASSSSIKSAHLQQKVNVTDIELFFSNLKITTKYFFDDVINVSKKVYYRDVIFFVQQIKRIVRTKNIVSYVHICFRETIQLWFSALNEEIQDWLIVDLSQLCGQLIEKYRFSRFKTFDMLKNEHYIIKMTQNMRSIDEYVQVITRYDRSTDIKNNDVILTYVWKNLDFELQRDIETSFIDDIIDNFAKRLQQISKLWLNKARQSITNREETAFQRELTKARRDMLI